MMAQLYLSKERASVRFEEGKSSHMPGPMIVAVTSSTTIAGKTQRYSSGKTNLGLLRLWHIH
jgi:hypothetical protein